ncbi:hypothetical protein KFL_011660030 [Klebsormidium nitens]|uniref:Uncharacterized protein n=1 Tax=Klebsormidium nitens TaxID=105231 RepID=A0A1Y1ITF9_KLENI|nr:hypothetical protein KFL_011660030 [Klebsormidium nitens]|eukprot:GAQ92849.1 hypothetical protein KFL_011660030 [Klebsormidium nitens]
MGGQQRVVTAEGASEVYAQAGAPAHIAAQGRQPQPVWVGGQLRVVAAGGDVHLGHGDSAGVAAQGPHLQTGRVGWQPQVKAARGATSVNLQSGEAVHAAEKGAHQAPSSEQGRFDTAVARMARSSEQRSAAQAAAWGPNGAMFTSALVYRPEAMLSPREKAGNQGGKGVAKICSKCDPEGRLGIMKAEHDCPFSLKNKKKRKRN